MRSIDIHAHLTPQCFWRATEAGGNWHTLRREQDARGREYAVAGSHRGQLPPRARWTPEERLADMDSLGVDMHVLSPYSGFYNYELDTTVAVRYLIDTVGIDRVVFGTDWPYDMVFDWPVSWILSLEGLTQDEKEAILWKNLERLLGL